MRPPDVHYSNKLNRFSLPTERILIIILFQKLFGLSWSRAYAVSQTGRCRAYLTITEAEQYGHEKSLEQKRDYNTVIPDITNSSRNREITNASNYLYALVYENQ